METLLQSQSVTTSPSAADHAGGGTVAAAAPGSVQLAQADGARSRFDSLLDLQLDLDVAPVDQARLSPESFPAFDDADLPAPLFLDDDLPAPLFLDDDLPAPSLADDDLPVDLTAITLDDLLDLPLSGSAPPTAGEVVRAAYRDAQPRQDSEPETDDERVEEEQTAEAEVVDTVTDPPAPSNAVAGDLSFIDPESFAEKAAKHDETGVLEAPTDQDIFGETAFGFDADTGQQSPAVFGSAEIQPLAASADESGGDSGDTGDTIVINGTPGDDLLIGTAVVEALHGFAGNDTLAGGGGADRLNAGAGDDVLVWDGADQSIDGAGGRDTLRVDAGDADLSIFGGNLARIEVVDLRSDPGANALVLTAQDVLDATDAGNTLAISGTGVDSLDAGGGWTYGGPNGSGSEVYTQVVGSETATLIVDPAIGVNGSILA